MRSHDLHLRGLFLSRQQKNTEENPMSKSDKTDLLDNQPPKPWREVWPVAEELAKLEFPRREGEARKAAALDMKLRGINRPILYFTDPVSGDCLIDADGVDKLDIAAEEGLLVVSKYSVKGEKEPRFVLEIRVDDGESEPVLREVPFLWLREEIDVYAAIAEVNLGSKLPIDRTQLRRIRSIYVIENYQKSDRQIAGELSIDHKTVAGVRAEAVQLGKIPQLETRLGADGKERRLPYVRPATQAALDADEERWETEEAARLKAEEEETAKREAEDREAKVKQEAAEREAAERDAKVKREAEEAAEAAKREAAERETAEQQTGGDGSTGDVPIETPAPIVNSNGTTRPTFRDVLNVWGPAELIQQAAAISDEEWCAALPSGTRFAIAEQVRGEYAGKGNGKAATLKATARAGWLRIMDRQLTGDRVQDADAIAEIHRDLHGLQQELKRAGIPAHAFRFETV
jgi:hypothetical protein